MGKSSSQVLRWLSRMVIVVAASSGIAAAATPSTIVVAPSGNDDNPGTLERPFATIERARAAVAERKIRATGPVIVALRGGTYYLDRPVVFTPGDSGTAAAPVVYTAYRDEQPVVSGGRQLHVTWRPFRGQIMMATVPAGLVFDQLFVNGTLQHLARYPNYDPNAQYFNGFAADCISPERVKTWHDPVGAIVHAMHRAHWGDFHYLVVGTNPDGTVKLEGGWQNNRQMGMHPSHRFVENVLEELDCAGEWYLDKRADTLYFWPPADVDLDTAKMDVSVLKHLFEFRGTMAKPVVHITLRGLTLTHTLRTFMEIKEPLLRSDWCIYRGGAVFMDGAEDCALQRCVLTQLGGNGIFVSNYARHITVTASKIANIGGNGICFVGSPAAVRSPCFEYHQTLSFDDIDTIPGPKTDAFPRDCRVDDCLLTRIGRIHKQSAGVQISMARGITVGHCSIYDVPRAGINISEGTWGGHVIEYCDVFDTVKETGDHGSFNSWGRDRYWHLRDCDLTQHPELPLLDAQATTIIRNNRWRCDHGWDIDLDDGSTNYHIYNNLCLHGGLKNREGFRRVVENNIMVQNGFHPHVWYANSGDVFRHNIVFKAYRPARMSTREPWGKELDYNFMHVPGSAGPATQLQKLSKRDRHSRMGDAMFVDPAAGNYQVQPGSPALALGFTNFPMDQFGVVSPYLRAEARTPQLPDVDAAVTTPPAKEKSTPTRQWLGATVRDVGGMGDVSSLGLANARGVLILKVSQQGPTATAGLRPNDVVIGLNDTTVANVKRLVRSTYALAPGTQITLHVIRNQDAIQLKLKLP